MLNRGLLLILLVASSINTIGQDINTYPKNVLYYELGGVGFGIFSINYENIISKGEFVSVSIGCGLSLRLNQGTVTHVGFNDHQLKIPIQANLLFGRSDHKFEFGYGMPIGLNKPEFGFEAGFYVLRLGYRYQSHKKGLFFRASLNPSFVVIMPFPMAGIGLGYTF